jgi:hypothetical protein
MFFSIRITRFVILVSKGSKVGSLYAVVVKITELYTNTTIRLKFCALIVKFKEHRSGSLVEYIS